MQTANINIRTDANLKKKADKLYNALGLNMSVAINMFLNESVRTNSLPLSLKLAPNDDTIEALKEVELMEKNLKKHKRYDSVDSFMEAMLREV